MIADGNNSIAICLIKAYLYLTMFLRKFHGIANQVIHNAVKLLLVYLHI